MQLRYYQQKAVDCVNNKFNGIIVLPTGTGKSLVVAGLAKKFPENHILILQPSKEILEQNYNKLICFIENKSEIGIYSASLNQKDIKRITLATIGSVKNHELFDKFKTIIIDEAHCVNAHGGQYKTLLRYNNPDILIGLTATPYRLHSNSFAQASWKFLHRTRPKLFKDIAYVYQNKQAFNDGYLCKSIIYEFSYDTSILQIRGNDYSEKSILRYNTAIRLHDKIKEIVLQCKRNHILIFTTSIEEAEIISDKLSSAGIQSSEVSSKNTKTEREKILSDFKSGKLKVVVNVGILTTGFDFPELDCIIGARPTMSLGLYYQMYGRGVRIHPGKESWDYFDLCGNINMFGNVEDYVIEGIGSQTCLKNANRCLIKAYEREVLDLSGNWIIPFGKYKGERISNLPIDYINYCIKNFENFSYKKQFELELSRRFEL